MLQNTGINSSGFFMWAESGIYFKGKTKGKIPMLFS